jgi:hypothetical protein
MMTQQAEIHGDWSMVEGPCAHREQAVPNGEWLMVEGEATKAVPNMSWADIVRIKADQKAIEEAQVRLQQQQWTQISSPNVTPQGGSKKRAHTNQTKTWKKPSIKPAGSGRLISMLRDRSA